MSPTAQVVLIAATAAGSVGVVGWIVFLILARRSIVAAGSVWAATWTSSPMTVRSMNRPVWSMRKNRRSSTTPTSVR